MFEHPKGSREEFLNKAARVPKELHLPAWQIIMEIYAGKITQAEGEKKLEELFKKKT